MSSRKTGRHMIDIVFSLALFCVFAASALLVVLIGANVYKKTVAQMDQSFNARTSVSYVVSKVRQNDVAGGIHLDSLAEVPALVLEQELEGQTFQTWIYHYDGALRELFVEKGGQFLPQDGQMIVEVPAFDFHNEGTTLVFDSIDKEGHRTTQQVTPRCGLTVDGKEAVL